MMLKISREEAFEAFEEVVADIPEIKLLSDFAVFDCETAPLDDDQLRKLCPPCEKLPANPGEFDESTVKYGNTKDKDKRAVILQECREKHQSAVQSYASDVAKAKADHFAKFCDKAALDAITGRVVAIGVSPCPLTGEGPAIINCDGDSEISGLKMFWWWMNQNIKDHRPMIGVNIHGFDLPFLIRRSWILGVPVPISVRNGRYWNPLFIDLMKVWTFDGYSQYVGLNALAAAFGLEGKIEQVVVDGKPIEVSGATFYKLWRENRKVAEAYLLQDLKLPGLIAQKMGVV